LAERPSVSEILARARSGPSGASSPPQKPAPKPAEPPSEPDRPLSASEKVAAIRARAAQKKAEPSAPPKPDEKPASSAAQKLAQARSKPPAPKPEPAPAPSAPSSRNRGIAWPLAAGAVLVLAAGFWIARSAGPREPASVVFDAASSRPTVSVDASRASDAGVFLVHAPLPDGSDGLYALSAHCTFLGCVLTWDPSQSRFVCPCHGCSYDLQGQPTAGPAPAPLPRLAIYRSADGRVHIDRLHELTSPSSEPPGAIRLN
jgi:nitrite reductase/ring-hydroxylating ferredoxin subunit